jgi:hypothetical protein
MVVGKTVPACKTYILDSRCRGRAFSGPSLPLGFYHADVRRVAGVIGTLFFLLVEVKRCEGCCFEITEVYAQISARTARR